MDRLLISGARILDPSNGTDETGDILITDDMISAVGGKIQCEGAAVINARGLIAAPGLVDMHVHLRDPGFTEKEDIFTGCRAAATGGVTSLLCMPNTNPAADSPETVRYIREKAENADARVYVAAAITKGLKSEELNDLAALRDAGAIALSDDGRPVVNTLLMAQAMRLAFALRLKVVSHCEDLFLSQGGKMNEGEISARLGIKGVPAAAEDCGTAREIALAAAYDVPVHICHVSTKTSVGMIRDAKRRGVRVTAETAPHYFALTENELLARDADYRMSPPLRTEEDRLAVIEGLCDGTIDAIATDHAPHTPAEKSDFLFAPNGSIGLETSLAAGMTYLVNEQFIAMNDLLRFMSTAPAALLGIQGGSLCVGEPADLVLFDPAERWTVDAARLHGKSRNAVFKGKELTGKVKKTICRGKIVFEDTDRKK
ncbi:dihydroorotase [Caproiciproducens sp.]|uniref:dihydroorotase n=1 Tax=Caproiciproducens sp. TaxID=1954376 RepID=UPI0028A20F8D|nr:dihydroorotase [Caproiciproducens sp.]